jgi:hypothetical protein
MQVSDEEFDYVVVGAGSAGWPCVAAAPAGGGTPQSSKQRLARHANDAVAGAIWRSLAGYGRICNMAGEPRAESGLIHTATFAGSTTHSLRSFHSAKASGTRANVTFFVSPGASETR